MLLRALRPDAEFVRTYMKVPQRRRQKRTYKRIRHIAVRDKKNTSLQMHATFRIQPVRNVTFLHSTVL